MSEKEHSVDFLMIKLLHVYATKIFHQLSREYPKVCVNLQTDVR